MCQTSHGWLPPHRYCDIRLTLQNHLHRHNKDKEKGHYVNNIAPRNPTN